MTGTIVAVSLVLFLVLLATGMPIAFSMALAGSAGLIAVGGMDVFFGIVQTTPYGNAANYLFLTVPMFILMAEILSASKIAGDLFVASNKWFGHFPGGLGIATVVAGAGFGAVCGSSTASAATLSAAAVPEMKKYRYKTHFSLGVSSVSGTLAFMIPPSMAFIIYGILTETGIGELFIAGIVPGLITLLGYVLTISLWIKKYPDVAPKSPVNYTLKEKWSSLKLVLPVLFLMLGLIISIYGGFCTPTEAGALSALFAMIIAIAMHRLGIKDMQTALKRTLKSTGMIMMIIIGAMVFSYYLTYTHVTQDIINVIVSSGISRWIVLIAVIILYLILGMIMDQAGSLILSLPFTFPLIMSLGFDPIWFGVIVCKTAEIGMVTPPVGLNVFVAAGATGESTDEAFKGVYRFVIVDLIILIILVLFPSLSTWLPSMMR